MRRTQAHFRGEVFEFQGLATPLIDVVAHLSNALCGGGGSGGGPREGSYGGGEPISLCIRRRLIEAHILAQRLAGATRRPTIDAGGKNAVEENAVSTGVSRLNCFPALILVQHRSFPNSLVVNSI